MNTQTTPCFEAFKSNIYDCEGLHLMEDVDYTVGMTGMITFKGQYLKELKDDWSIWKDSWNAAAHYYNRVK